MLRFLKRAYWPFGWQSGRGPLAGGFMSAAMVSSCKQYPDTFPASACVRENWIRFQVPLINPHPTNFFRV